ncbi:MAG: putative Ig domain-containing protein [Bryobacteraceae bacterium]
MKRGLLFSAALILGVGIVTQAQVLQPVITSINPAQTTAGTASFTLSVYGSGFRGDGVSRVRWNGTLLPTNYLNAGLLRATVDSSLIQSPGTAQIDVINNGQLPTATKLDFIINPPPAIISTSAPPRAVIGRPYTHQFVATGGTAPLTWSFSGALPPGLLLNSAGLLYGTPTQEGLFTLTIGARDSVGVSAEAVRFTLLVGPPPVRITTASLLPNGVVGVDYSLTLTAADGTPPYSNWLVAGGVLPQGLILDGGTIKGKPEAVGTYSFRIAVSDSTGESADQSFTLTITNPPLAIMPESPLPSATRDVSYSQSFTATGGTPPYGRWALISGSLPLGLRFITTQESGPMVSGTPTQTGLFGFTISVTDAAGITATRLYSLTVNVPPPAISTSSPLPNATVGLTYSQTFVATGGTTPYNWTVSGPPPGLSLSAAGLLSGTPTAPGTYTFTVTVNGLTSKQFTLTVVMPPPPVVSVTGLADTVSPAQQPSFDIQLSSAYSLPITGTITLTFIPDAVTPSDDPAIQFSSGGRTLNFSIPAGQTRAFPATAPALQTGMIAGRIDLTLKISAAGQDITPTPAPTRSVQIARTAPRIVSVQIADRTSTGFSLRITGYSTPRQVTQAVFSFASAAGGNLQTTQLTVPVDSAFTAWYGGASSAQFGSSFLYTQPFTVSGNMTAIASVSVTLVNSTGSSTPVSATF